MEHSLASVGLSRRTPGEGRHCNATSALQGWIDILPRARPTAVQRSLTFSAVPATRVPAFQDSTAAVIPGASIEFRNCWSVLYEAVISRQHLGFWGEGGKKETRIKGSQKECCNHIPMMHSPFTHKDFEKVCGPQLTTVMKERGIAGGRRL